MFRYAGRVVSHSDDKKEPSPDLVTLGNLLKAIDEVTPVLAADRGVPEEARSVIDQLRGVFRVWAPASFPGSDPYLVEALLLGLFSTLDAELISDKAAKRRQLRISLERVRQALRDLIAEHDVAASQPAKSIARWLSDTTKVSNAELADLIGVSARTYQRWVSPSEPTEPSPDEERRLRTVARAVEQLRWSMTPMGVLRWFQMPHPALSGQTPADVLDKPAAYEELHRLAASSRAMVAT
jgi:uncharacterized protein (DUF2384 family)